MSSANASNKFESVKNIKNYYLSEKLKHKLSTKSQTQHSATHNVFGALKPRPALLMLYILCAIPVLLLSPLPCILLHPAGTPALSTSS